MRKVCLFIGRASAGVPSQWRCAGRGVNTLGCVTRLRTRILQRSGRVSVSRSSRSAADGLRASVLGPSSRGLARASHRESGVHATAPGSTGSSAAGDEHAHKPARAREHVDCSALESARQGACRARGVGESGVHARADCTGSSAADDERARTTTARSNEAETARCVADKVNALLAPIYSSSSSSSSPSRWRAVALPPLAALVQAACAAAPFPRSF